MASRPASYSYAGEWTLRSRTPSSSLPWDSRVWLWGGRWARVWPGAQSRASSGPSTATSWSQSATPSSSRPPWSRSPGIRKNSYGPLPCPRRIRANTPLAAGIKAILRLGKYLCPLDHHMFPWDDHWVRHKTTCCPRFHSLWTVQIWKPRRYSWDACICLRFSWCHSLWVRISRSTLCKSRWLKDSNRWRGPISECQIFCAGWA